METYRILLFFCAATTGYTTLCPRHIDQVEEGRVCRKECMTDNDCQGKKRCYCDGVCGMSCFNKESDCGEPDVIYYGNVVRDKTSWNGTAQYSCDEGYILNGESLRKCHSDRKWSGSPPSCEQERELEEVTYCPPSFKYVEEGRRCRTPCKSHGDCSGRKGCYCDGLCGNSCFNKESECGEPDSIENGSVRRNRISWGGVALYYCNEGYFMNGDSERRCHSDRKWSGNAPTCEQGCTHPDDVERSFADSSDGFRTGEEYEFFCGTVLIPNQIRCLNNPHDCDTLQIDQILVNLQKKHSHCCGEYFSTSACRNHPWHKIVAMNICSANGCPTVCNPAREDATGTSNDLNTDGIDSISGYYRIGNAMRTCMSDLQWSPAEYRCYPQQCDSISSVLHGTITYTQRQNYGSIATLECDRGYVKSSSESMRCQNGRGETRYGEWEGALPTCNAIMCPEPPPPEHGSVDDYGISREFGDRVRYDCKVGYTLHGDSSGTCREDGSWGVRPTCIVDPDCDFNTYATPTCGYDNQNNRWTRTRATEPMGLEGYVIQTSNSGSLKSPEIPVAWAENAICLKFYYKLERDYYKRVAKLEVQSTEPYPEVYWTSHENEQSGIWLDAVINFSLDKAVRYQFTRIRGTVSMDELHVEDHECDDRCDPNPCQNGGTCVNRKSTYTCFCAPNFVGDQCQTDERCANPPRDISNGERVESYPQRYPDTTIDYACNDNYKFAGQDTVTKRKTIRCVWINIASGSRWSEDPNSLSCEVDPDCNFNTPATPTCGYDTQNGRWTRIRAIQPMGSYGYIIQTSNSGSLRSPEIPVNWAENAICLKFSYKLERDYNNRVAKFEVQSTEPYPAAAYWTSHEKEQSGVWLDAVINFSLDNAVRYQFTGVRGTVSIDELHVADRECDDRCDPNPCQNGGTCVNRMSTYTCFCAPNFIGAQCQTDERCTNPPRGIPNGGIVESSPQVYPDSTINYACNDNYKFTGYTLTKRKTIRCVSVNIASGSRWSEDPNSLSCEEITCRRLVPGGHQQLSNDQDTWRVGDRVTYVCDAGYVFGDSATATRRCGEDGLWSGTQPVCIEPYCTYNETGNNPASPVMVRGRYDVGDTLSFRCRRGYELVGEPTLTCNEHLTWSGNTPTCQRVSCGIPPVIENEYRRTEPTEVHRYNDVFTYASCKRGYYLKGQSKITCQEDGSWTPHPVCKEIQECAEVEAPEHATMQIKRNSRKFACDESLYELEGEKIITCHESGTWSAPPPLCKVIPPTEKTTYEGIEYLVYAQPFMRSNFTDAKKICGRIGANLAVLYTHRVREELERTLGKLTAERVHLYIGLQRIYTSGIAPTTRFEWITDDIPTQLPSTWNKSDTQMHWKSEYPKSGGSDCGVIYKESGWQGEYMWQNLNCAKKRFFVCQRNYRPCVPNPCKHGGTCRENGQAYICNCTMDYTGTTCATGKTCRRPYTRNTYITEVNGEGPTNQPTYRRHQSITFSCRDRTHVIVGQSRITCLPNGQWDFQVPDTCVRHCPMSDAPNNGHWSEVSSKKTFYVGDTLQFLCNKGFRFSGSNNTVACQHNGAWGRINGFCADETACDPNPCQFGGVCTPTASGHRCTCEAGYSGENCEEGHRPCVPNPCKHGGTCRERDQRFLCHCTMEYMGTTCAAEKTCRKPYTVYTYITKVNGKRPTNQHTYRRHQNITFSCRDPTHVVSGQSTITCLPTGQWDSSAPDTCDETTCEPNPCQFGGVCTPTASGHRCTCGAGYSGVNCEERQRPCVPNPCKHGGTCRERGQGYICDCTMDYTGTTCAAEKTCRKPFTLYTYVTEVNGERPTNRLTIYRRHQSITFSCRDPTRVVSGQSTITCLPTGQWDSSAPDTCVKHCPMSDAPNNGHWSDVGSKKIFHVDDTLRFLCNRGFRFSGSIDTVVCQHNGAWGRINGFCADETACEPNPCQFGGVCTPTASGHRCTCQAGYSGENCEEGQQPCVPNPCKHGGTCRDWGQRYICDCTREYTGTTCAAEKTCRKPYTVYTYITEVNGERPTNQLTYRRHQSITFSCRDRTRVIAGQSTITCLPTGQWDSSAPDTCDQRPCVPNPCKHGGTCREQGRRYICDCTMEYTGTTCAAEKTCRRPYTVYTYITEVNGKRPTNQLTYHRHQSITLSCRDRTHVIAGQSTITCLPTGQWDSPVPNTCEQRPCVPNPCQHGGTCRGWGQRYICDCTMEYIGTTCATEKTCRKPYAVNTYITEVNGKRPTNRLTIYRRHQSITFSCRDRTHAIAGQSTITCLPTGQWDSSVPDTCVKHCPMSDAPNNGHWSDVGSKRTFYVGDTLRFLCNRGFRFSGSIDTVVCQSSGAWGRINGFCADETTCEPNPCQFGGVCSPTASGHRCTCEAGYSGENCEEGTPCPPPVLPDRAYISDEGNEFPPLTKVDIQCLDGYILTGGVARLTCKGTGRWSETDAACKADNCGHDPFLMPKGITIEGPFRGRYDVNERVRLICRAGGTPTADTAMEPVSTCQLGGRWLPSLHDFTCDN